MRDLRKEGGLWLRDVMILMLYETTKVEKNLLAG